MGQVFSHSSRRSIAISLIAWFVSGGCLNLRGTPIELPPDPVPSQVPNFEDHPQDDASLSGALDGPTLRLALRDLAVILDTLGRLEQIHPDHKQQMLRELADADAATAAAVVSQWRARLPELQARSDRDHAPALDQTARPEVERAPKPTTSEIARAESPAMDTRSENYTSEPAATNLPQTGDESIVVEPGGIEPPEPPSLPSWDDLLDSLVGLTRDRTEEPGPDATRARMQLALLELVRQTEDRPVESPPDAQLWTHLDPAIQYCFGNAPASQPPPPDVVRSLQVATELLRGPRRFQIRGLAFCSRIRGFGNVDRVANNTFTPGQPVLLYSEAEHFFSDAVPGGFRTRIASVIELLDAAGRPAWSQDFGSVEDVSSGPRRDYFLSYRFCLPQNLKPGLYSVRVTLTDELANRTASNAIALSIR